MAVMTLVMMKLRMLSHAMMMLRGFLETLLADLMAIADKN